MFPEREGKKTEAEMNIDPKRHDTLGCPSITKGFPEFLGTPFGGGGLN